MLQQGPSAGKQKGIWNKECRQAENQGAKRKGMGIDVEADNLCQDYGDGKICEHQTSDELIHVERMRWFCCCA
jgi:hypothetical protein